MSFNNQETLKVPATQADTQNHDHMFLSISPQRSASPRSILSEQIQNQQVSNSSSIGSFRTRARAGTLPSRLYTNGIVNSNTTNNNNQSYSPSFNSQMSGNTFDPNSLNLDALSISNSPVLEPHQNGGNGTASKTRLRSGSLLGLSDSNSIWSNDSSNNNSSQLPPALDPQLSHQPSMGSINLMPNPHSPMKEFPIDGPSPTFPNAVEEFPSRVRAYSTNNVILNDPTHYHLQPFEEESMNYNQLNNNHNSSLPNDHFNLNNNLNANIPSSINNTNNNNNNNNNHTLNQMNETTQRQRAQTYQNGVNNPLPLSFTSTSISEIPSGPSFLSKSMSNEPLLLDNIDPRLLNWTSTYQDSSLGPTNTLFLSNLPPHAVTPVSLANVLLKFGRILTVRLFTGNESSLVEFESLECAMQAKAQLNHQELTPGYPCLVSFAKILPLQQQSQSPNFISDNNTSISTNNQQPPMTQQNLPPPQIHITDQTLVQSSEIIPTSDLIINTIGLETPKLDSIVNDIYDCVLKLGIPTTEGAVKNILKNALKYTGFDNDFGPLPDPIPIRDYDAPKLRETRKLIDANAMSQFEIEELSLAMLHELPELSSDYLGNTVVQKLFEFSSTSIKHIMLKEVSPYLAQMGIHKNGTWSAQKMINVADSPMQKLIVAESLKPYCVPLFNDQFGNYVIQCSLKFGSPWNDFIFETILAKFWLIAQNRFGARALRACLESHEASMEQTALTAAAIILHAEHLAINQNAALLITWFLDTCTLPNRHSLLAPRLIPHLAQLCTHKLASLTILKILNNRGEAEAKNMILNALFGPVTSENLNENGGESFTDLPKPPEVLEQILQDNVHGATFIFKVLSNPQLEEDVRKHVVSQCRRVLLELNVNSYQGYKRLMDEVGLGNRNDSHRRNHSNGGHGQDRNGNANGNNGSSSRNKNRQNKSPQNVYNRRSSSNNQMRPQQQQQPQQQHQHQASLQGPPPSQPQFVQNQNDFMDYQSQQYYQPTNNGQFLQPEIFPFDGGFNNQQLNDVFQLQGFQKQPQQHSFGFGTSQY